MGEREVCFGEGERACLGMIKLLSDYFVIIIIIFGSNICFFLVVF